MSDRDRNNWQERWNPGMRSDDNRQDWRRSEFGVGSEYGPDYAFREFGRADDIRNRWVHDYRTHGGEREDWGDRDRVSMVDVVNRGRFTGIGPKNYRRSDERIREDICDLLTQHGEIDASDIDVQVGNGEVTLAGTIPDRYMKRLVEDVIDHVIGIRDVHNQLRVAERATARRAA